MSRLITLLVVSIFLVSFWCIGASQDANAAADTQTVTGTIVLVGNNVMKIRNDQTGMENEYRINEAQEDGMTTGYNATLQVKNGRVVSYQLQGIPNNVAEIVYSAEGLGQSSISGADMGPSHMMTE